MKQILQFWKKDTINKLIVIHTFLLVAGAVAGMVFFFNLPEGKTFGGMVDNLFPTPTISPKVLMTQAAEQAILKSYYATASVPPTITTAPILELFYTATATPEGYTVLPTDTPPPSPTAFVLPTATPKPLALTATPVSGQAAPTAAGPVVVGLDCLPAGTPETGRVLDVLSPDTLKVLIGQYTYVVRFIGVAAPDVESFALMSKNTTGSLVFGRDVTLYKDQKASDDLGMMLRYVVVNGKMPAIELLEKGLLTFDDPAPNNACSDLLKQAEQKARTGKVGLWAVK